MHVGKLEKLKEWLNNQLEGIYNGDKSNLTKYIVAILWKDKSFEQLQNTCCEKLHAFLEGETKGFVQSLIDMLKAGKIISLEELRAYDKSHIFPQSSSSATASTSKGASTSAAAGKETVATSSNTNSKETEEKRQQKKQSDEVASQSSQPKSQPPAASSQQQSRNRRENSAASLSSSSSSDSSGNVGDRVKRGIKTSGSTNRSDRQGERHGDRDRSSTRSTADGPQTAQRRKPLKPGANDGVISKAASSSAASMHHKQQATHHAPIPSHLQQFQQLQQHQQSQSNNNPPGLPIAKCFDYEQKGICMKGPLCPFAHGENPLDLDQLQSRLSQFTQQQHQQNQQQNHHQQQQAAAAVAQHQQQQAAAAVAVVAAAAASQQQQQSNQLNLLRSIIASSTSSSAASNQQQQNKSRNILLVDSSTHQSANQTTIKSLSKAPISPIRFDQYGSDDAVISSGVAAKWDDKDDASDVVSNMISSNRNLYNYPVYNPSFSGSLQQQQQQQQQEKQQQQPISSRIGSNNNNTNNIGGGGGGGKFPVTNKVLLLKVPWNQNQVGTLNNHFQQFGHIVNINVMWRNQKDAALIEFSRASEALAAYRSSEPILNNRFIRIRLYTANQQQQQQQSHQAGSDLIGGGGSARQQHANQSRMYQQQQKQNRPLSPSNYRVINKRRQSDASANAAMMTITAQNELAATKRGGDVDVEQQEYSPSTNYEVTGTSGNKLTAADLEHELEGEEEEEGGECASMVIRVSDEENDSEMTATSVGERKNATRHYGGGGGMLSGEQEEIYDDDDGDENDMKQQQQQGTAGVDAEEDEEDIAAAAKSESIRRNLAARLGTRQPTGNVASGGAGKAGVGALRDRIELKRVRRDSWGDNPIQGLHVSSNKTRRDDANMLEQQKQHQEEEARQLDGTITELGGEKSELQDRLKQMLLEYQQCETASVERIQLNIKIKQMNARIQLVVEKINQLEEKKKRAKLELERQQQEKDKEQLDANQQKDKKQEEGSNGQQDSASEAVAPAPPSATTDTDKKEKVEPEKSAEQLQLEKLKCEIADVEVEIVQTRQTEGGDPRPLYKKMLELKRRLVKMETAKPAAIATTSATAATTQPLHFRGAHSHALPHGGPAAFRRLSHHLQQQQLQLQQQQLQQAGGAAPHPSAACGVPGGEIEAAAAGEQQRIGGPSMTKGAQCRLDKRPRTVYIFGLPSDGNQNSVNSIFKYHRLFPQSVKIYQLEANEQLEIPGGKIVEATMSHYADAARVMDRLKKYGEVDLTVTFQKPKYLENVQPQAATASASIAPRRHAPPPPAPAAPAVVAAAPVGPANLAATTPAVPDAPPAPALSDLPPPQPIAATAAATS